MTTKKELQHTEESEVRPANQNPTRYVVTPKVDVFEDADEYLLVADLPGVQKEALDLSWARGELTLEGHFADRYYRRAFTLPDGIDSAHIAADLANGVLTLHLPKSPEVKPRKIKVHAA